MWDIEIVKLARVFGHPVGKTRDGAFCFHDALKCFIYLLARGQNAASYGWVKKSYRFPRYRRVRVDRKKHRLQSMDRQKGFWNKYISQACRMCNYSRDSLEGGHWEGWMMVMNDNEASFTQDRLSGRRRCGPCGCLISHQLVGIVNMFLVTFVFTDKLVKASYPASEEGIFFFIIQLMFSPFIYARRIQISYGLPSSSTQIRSNSRRHLSRATRVWASFPIHCGYIDGP